MSPNKPLKLLPESVRTFLEVGLKRIVNEQNSTRNKKRKKLWMFKFVRMLCVSSSYLNCSRRTNLDIYRLNLHFTQFPDKLWFSFTSKYYGFAGANSFYLTYDCVCKLIKMLLPAYTGAYFEYRTNALLFEKQFELLKLTQGKIGFYLDNRFNVQRAQKMLKTLAERTHDLDCSIKFFMFDKNLHFPNLNYLFIDTVENSDHIFYILQQKIKHLQFGSISENFAIGNGKLTESKNETIRTLKLSFDRISYVKLEKLLEYFKKSCLNLKHLDVNANFSHNKLSADQIPDQVIDYVSDMNDLKARFGNYLISTFIKFVVRIYMGGQFSSTWIKTVCKNSEINGWQIKSSGDELKMAFDDAGCKLEMSVNVYRCGFGQPLS